MRIQAAVELCRHRNCLARPISWKGQGRAVDLGQTLTQEGVKAVEAFGTRGALVGRDWHPTPEEILGTWEAIFPQDLRKETQS